MAGRPKTQTTVVFSWGSCVYSCSDERWETILRYIAERDPRLDEYILGSMKLSDRGFVHLGLMTREDAQARLEARKEALAGAKKDDAPVKRQRFVPPKMVAK